MKPKYPFYIGIAILAILLVTYFIKIQTESGQNYIIKTKLLSLLIFYNPVILTIYIIIAFILIWFGIKHKIEII
ncbi:hypothetical protein COU62_02395 [Candidatus Pacearchaeota archaeon CG10_big_fil_rev_8_21_14_0_10_35_219]|nr:MAG: hypothetical protein AUJ63_04535 [Candidatus Pacearchaeota archaeon CG1_02_35_32]PIO07817.1 MAG: hypothetical protein COU62_02395 [Candidatus Pacearchaeota archaeon CG10_big_fil_rev_8_21_14_0_10_35_219]PIY81039.1 MAG: hypothetical protein COY79_04505 [Candidatus Pacearchaeota archaeon CG_4_10_14_0_8_um_filter_35_169]PIZ79908.1 MAG: hypothetical protein COY00_02810 [Candidatus Pacearchaeota archaeon CG_4_10_14_0_2_um_filter_35_33]PJA70254.1 MAG: hypothetical protein CO155_01270 [Candidat